LFGRLPRIYECLALSLRKPAHRNDHFATSQTWPPALHRSLEAGWRPRCREQSRPQLRHVAVTNGQRLNRSGRGSACSGTIAGDPHLPRPSASCPQSLLKARCGPGLSPSRGRNLISRELRKMTLRPVCLGLCLAVCALGEPASAAGGCGVGCSVAPRGGCVRDGWQQALPVRNVCPATSRPAPPCGPYHRWDRRSQMCVPQ